MSTNPKDKKEIQPAVNPSIQEQGSSSATTQIELEPVAAKKEKWQEACKEITDIICIIPKKPLLSFQKIPQEPLDYFLDSTADPAVLRSVNTFSTEEVANTVLKNVIKKIGDKDVQLSVSKEGNSFFLVVSGKAIPPNFGEYLSGLRAKALLQQASLPASPVEVDSLYKAAYQKIVLVPCSWQPEPISVNYTWDPVIGCLKTGEMHLNIVYEINEYLSKVLNPMGIRTALLVHPYAKSFHVIKLLGGVYAQNFARANGISVSRENKKSVAIPDEKEVIKKISVETLLYDPQNLGGSYYLYTQNFDKDSAYKIADALVGRINYFGDIDVGVVPTSKSGIFCVVLSGPAITPAVGQYFLAQKNGRIERIAEQKTTEANIPLRLETAAATGDIGSVEKFLQQGDKVTERVVLQAIFSLQAPAVVAKLLPKFDAALLVTAIKDAENRVVEEARKIPSPLSSSPVDPEAKQATPQAPVVNLGQQTLDLLLGEYEKIVTLISSTMRSVGGEEPQYGWRESDSNIVKLRVQNRLMLDVADGVRDALLTLPLVKQYGLQVITTTHLDRDRFTIEVGGALFAKGLANYLKNEHELRSSQVKPGGDGYQQALVGGLCIPIPAVNASAMSRLFSQQPGKMHYFWDKADSCVQSIELDNAETAAQVQAKLIAQLARIKLNVQVTVKSVKEKFVIQLKGSDISEAFVTYLQRQQAQKTAKEVEIFFEGREKKEPAPLERPRTQSTSERSTITRDTNSRPRTNSVGGKKRRSKEPVVFVAGTKEHYKLLAAFFCVAVPSKNPFTLYYEWNATDQCAQSSVLTPKEAGDMQEMLLRQVKIAGSMAKGIEATVVEIAGGNVIRLTGPQICEASVAYLQRPASPPADSKRNQTPMPRSQSSRDNGERTISAPHSRAPGIGGASSPQPTASGQTPLSDEQRQHLDKLFGIPTKSS